MSTMPEKYEGFLKNKVKLAQNGGFDIDPSIINPSLYHHQRLMTQWLISGGRRALFAAFGLGKTAVQLETIRCTLEQTGGPGLIVAPLGVRQEFTRDAKKILGWEEGPRFIRSLKEASATGIHMTNYETIREGKLDPRKFKVASLDEASILRGFGGTKTFREFMRLFTGDAGPLGDRRGIECVPYRFVATATPSPNDYIELLAYADFLGIMDVSQAKTRFFKRDSTQADKLTLHPHKEEEFWLWVASWALFVQKPSDLTGNLADDEGYIMPEVDVRWHELASDHSTAAPDRNGQGNLYKNVAIGLSDAAREKKESLNARIEKLMEIRSEDPVAHRIIWHDLEVERAALKKAIPSIVTVQGKDTDDHKEKSILGFSDGEFQEIGGKPCMLGSGTNFQRHCWWEVYIGIGFKFNDFIQAMHRVLRFGQQHMVRIDIIYTEAERQVRKVLERKWNQHNDQLATMTEINKKYGLSQAAMAQALTRGMGIERIEVTGENFTVVQADNVLESKNIATNSLGLIITSWPFANQYEYSPNYADFGHSSNTKEFFEQMDFLTPESFRALKPGRIYALHVKDRIIPGGMTGLGFQTVYPFHMDCIQHMIKHGFAYIGMKTIVTDVVRENNQTYRLGWTEQCKDGSKMGVGMPEYLLLFRKPQTETSKSYADEPVVKHKPLQIKPDHVICPSCQSEIGMEYCSATDVDTYYCTKCAKDFISTNIIVGETQPFNRNKNLPLVPHSGYSRSRWQVDAHGFARSAGDRLLTPSELQTLNHKMLFRLFRKHSLETIYDFEQHVKIGETLEGFGKMPSDFMLLQPQSWQEDVWTDITRMLTLNGSQWSHGKEMHICPLQFDIVDRCIMQMSNEGDIVHDPFGGLMTVPYRAILKGRKGHGIELNPTYFLDGAAYCKAAETKTSMPSLFDTIDFVYNESEETPAA